MDKQKEPVVEVKDEHFIESEHLAAIRYSAELTDEALRMEGFIEPTAPLK